jgi:hypothetical protein
VVLAKCDLIDKLGVVLFPGSVESPAPRNSPAASRRLRRRGGGTAPARLFVSLEDPDTLFFMRGFPDMQSREPMKAKFYEGELWKTELEQTLMPLLEKYDVVLVEDVEGRFNW